MNIPSRPTNRWGTHNEPCCQGHACGLDRSLPCDTNQRDDDERCGTAQEQAIDEERNHIIDVQQRCGSCFHTLAFHVIVRGNDICAVCQEQDIPRGCSGI